MVQAGSHCTSSYDKSNNVHGMKGMIVEEGTARQIHRDECSLQLRSTTRGDISRFLEHDLLQRAFFVNVLDINKNNRSHLTIY